MAEASQTPRKDQANLLPSVPQTLFFENLPALVKAEVIASLLQISITTIYDWRYRKKQKGVPHDLFLKFNRRLYLRTEVLKRWIISKNPSAF